MRQRYKAFLAENMFVIEEAQSQAYLADYRCFLFFLLLSLDLYDLEWQY